MTNAVVLAQAGSNNVTMRNRLINGGMVIDQRNNGASVTLGSGGAYTLDRWRFYSGQASKLSVQQNAGSVTPPAGFINYLGLTSLSAYSVLSTDSFTLQQKIEGLNVADLAWGTASAATVTLSFWVRSSLTGAFGGAIYNSAQTRSYPFSYTINSANTWEQKSVTIAGDTSGTWLTTNGTGIELAFSLGAGSTLSGTAGAWANAYYAQPTGSTSVVGTNGATFYITGVQLEKGSTATPFEQRLYGTELALCQRYYWRFTNTTAGIVPVANLQAYNTTSAYGKFFDLPVVMRATPTANNGGSVQPTNSAGSPQTAFTGGNINATTASLYTGAYTGSTGLVAGNVTVVYLAVSGWFDASAEL